MSTARPEPRERRRRRVAAVRAHPRPYNECRRGGTGAALRRLLASVRHDEVVTAARGIVLGVPCGGLVGGLAAGLCGVLSAALTGTGARGTFMLATGMDALSFGVTGGVVAGGVLGAVAAVGTLGVGRRVAAGIALGVLGGMVAAAFSVWWTCPAAGWGVTFPVAALSGAVAGGAVGALFEGGITFREARGANR